MEKEIRVLMVDDHPMTIWGYELTLRDYAPNHKWSISKAFDSDQALQLLKKNRKRPFELVLLDLNLPVSVKESIFNGEDLGHRIKMEYPDIKIIVLTMLSDHLRITNILRKLQPNGFMLKTEVTPESLVSAILKVLEDRTFFSRKIDKMLSSKIGNVEKVTELDRRILYYISVGEKMKNLPKLIPMSMSSIERRKKFLKMVFELSGNTDRELIFKAKEKGFLG